MAEGFSQKVREAAMAFGEFTLDDIVLKLAVKTYAERRDIRAVLKGFRKSGEVSLIRKDLYRYQGRQTALPLEEKIWRAIRIKERFTRRDIVRLSGASDAHTKSYIQFLYRTGFVIRLSGGQAHETAVYGLVGPDKAPLDHPKMPRRTRKK